MKEVPRRSRPATYHHGDLRQALLLATEDVLRERGLQGFTLRECARRAGVTHSAPAHHFGDARGLLSEFAATGFEQLLTSMRAFRKKSAVDTDPFSVLKAVGLGYVDFGVRHPAHFAIMFQTDRLDLAHPRLRQASVAAFAELSGALAGIVPRTMPAPDFQARAMLAWAAVHGYVSLVLDGRTEQYFKLRRGAAREAAAMADRTLELLRNAV